MARRVLSTLIPERVKRVIDRLRQRRFLAVLGPAATRFVTEHGLEVTGGPFRGMRYLPGLERTTGALVAKLLGVYERELHGAVGNLAESDVTHLIDVGSAEGYYAVGFARLMPHVTVHAYDIDSGARDDCRQLATLNEVSDRVIVGSSCSPSDLAGFPAHRVALFCDCEGYERTLLDPKAAPILRHWTILVELHDFIDPSISQTIRARFAATHEFELIPGEPRDPARYPALEGFTRRERRAMLSEYRPTLMSWALLRPTV